MKRTYTNFAGGVNKQIGPIVPDMGDFEALSIAEDAINWECSEQGLLKRPGFNDVIATLDDTPDPVPIADLGAAITGIFEYNNGGSLERIVCAGDKIYVVAGSNATEVLSGQTPGAYYQSVTWDDGAGTEVLILLNGADDPVEYDGSTCVPITFIDPDDIFDGATPAFGAVFRGRIVFGGDPDHPHRLWTPRPGTYNNFDNSENTVDAFDVDAGYRGKLTGVKSLTDDFLVIYKEGAIRRLQGISPFGAGAEQFQLRDVTDAFGCIAPRTLVGNDVEHYFLAEDGLRQLRPIENYGDIDPQQPTYPIQPLVNDWNFSPNVIADACAVIDKATKQIWLSVPGGGKTTNNKLLNYDIITKTIDFRGDDEIPASYLAYVNRRVCSGDYDGQIHDHGATNSYAGGLISSEWLGKYIAHHGVGAFKRYKKLMLFADANSGGDVIVQWSILQEDTPITESSTETIDSGTLWDNALWEQAVWSAGQNKIFHLTNLGRGQAIALKFVNASATQRVNIRQVDLEYDVFGTARG